MKLTLSNHHLFSIFIFFLVKITVFSVRKTPFLCFCQNFFLSFEFLFLTSENSISQSTVFSVTVSVLFLWNLKFLTESLLLFASYTQGCRRKCAASWSRRSTSTSSSQGGSACVGWPPVTLIMLPKPWMRRSSTFRSQATNSDKLKALMKEKLLQKLSMKRYWQKF